ncbi:MAG: AarF/ABC1/UbiB kinase family protein [Saprospiraceae bacterium]|nr:AarF/ABC1/UbiB kinase family protein [Saprospiraceae bacterium]
MKEQDSIPVHKIHRASKMVTAGAKVGVNYLKYYTKKVLTGESDKRQLEEDNAEDIYESLSELKGSALKAVQMMSMDQGLLPGAYAEKFQMAQYSAPPLSYPLVMKTFQREFGKNPEEVFESFGKKAVNAASIGQVHKGIIGDKTFAVKVQYPGVAESVKQDLKMAKPLAARIMGIKEQDLELYMDEVETKLLEETDYELELHRSVDITNACRHLEGLVFPEYYPALSGKKIITMDWLEGQLLSEWLKTNPTQEQKDQIGQYLWDFYHFQIHELRMVHADPHPGNFMVTRDGKLAVIDFGCIKEIPESFYESYFKLLYETPNDDPAAMKELFYDLEFLKRDEDFSAQTYFFDLFNTSVQLLSRPFRTEEFDFSDKAFFEEIYSLAKKISTDEKVRKNNAARGSKDGIYINRTYYGLYQILHSLTAKIQTRTAMLV